MKARRFLWALLPVAAAFALTSCSSSDDNFDQPVTPTSKDGGKGIPFTLKVGNGDITRATVDNDNKTLRFASGDKLYVSNEDGSIHAVFDVPAEAVGQTSLTIDGTIEAENVPADGTQFTVVLVGSENKAITVSDGKVTGVTYDKKPVANVATAVKQYSNIRGTGAYSQGQCSVDLYQNTAFLNFTVQYTNIYYPATAAAENIVVTNNNATIGSGTVTTTVSKASNLSTVKAAFVLPVAKGTKMKSASVKVSTFDAITLTTTETLDGKVYNVNKSLSLATNMAVGNIVGANGRIYANVNAAVNAGTTAVGVIAYLGDATGDGTYKHGLVMSLRDCNPLHYYWCDPENQGNSAKYTTWQSAVTTVQDGRATTWISNGVRNSNSWPAYKAAMNNAIQTTAKITKNVNNSAVTKMSQIQESKWFLPSLYQWNQILKAGAKKNGVANPKNIEEHESGKGDANYVGPTWSAFFVNANTNPGVNGLDKDDGIYWSSTDGTVTTGNSSKAWVMDNRFGRVELNSKKRTDGNQLPRVRAVFAF